MTTKPCQLTTRSSFVTTDSSRTFKFPMLITWVTTVSSSGSDDNVVIKISHGIVVKMTTKIFTVEGTQCNAWLQSETSVVLRALRTVTSHSWALAGSGHCHHSQSLVSKNIKKHSDVQNLSQQNETPRFQIPNTKLRVLSFFDLPSPPPVSLLCTYHQAGVWLPRTSHSSRRARDFSSNKPDITTIPKSSLATYNVELKF